MSTINWNQYIAQAEAAGESLDEFTPLPAGSYDVNILKGEAKKTKNGKDMVVATYVVEGGPYAGRRLWHNFVVSPESPKAMAILIRQLSILGVRPLLEQNATFEQIAAAIKDVALTVKVSVGEYGGKPKNEVDSIAARTGSAIPGGASGLPAGPAGLPI